MRKADVEADRLVALSADAALLRQLARPRLFGRVHSVFRGALNIASFDGDLVTLAQHGSDNAPATAVVDSGDLAAHGILAGMEVEVRDDGPWLGGVLRVDLRAARPWQPTLPHWNDAPGALAANLAVVGQALAQQRQLQDARLTRIELDALAQVRQRGALVLEALRNEDFERAGSEAHGLLGLGPGLTPAGDDFLLGVLAALNLPGSPLVHRAGDCASVLAAARGRTTAISVAALAHAAAGRVRESIAGLLDSVLHGGGEALQEATQRVLAIGSTSGTEIVEGLLAGLQAQLATGATRSGAGEGS